MICFWILFMHLHKVSIVQFRYCVLCCNPFVFDNQLFWYSLASKRRAWKQIEKKHFLIRGVYIILAVFKFLVSTILRIINFHVITFNCWHTFIFMARATYFQLNESCMTGLRSTGDPSYTPSSRCVCVTVFLRSMTVYLPHFCSHSLTCLLHTTHFQHCRSLRF